MVITKHQSKTHTLTKITVIIGEHAEHWRKRQIVFIEEHRGLIVLKYVHTVISKESGSSLHMPPIPTDGCSSKCT